MAKNNIMLIKNVLRKHLMQKKNCIVILLLMALFVYLEYPIKEYAIQNGAISVWIVSTFSADLKYQMFIFFGLIVWVSDFQNNFQEFCDYREKLLVQIVSMTLLTLLYSIVCIVLSIIPIIGHANFELHWNSTALQLAQHGYDTVHGIISISDSVIELFSPTEAMLAMFVLQWLAGTFIGVLILAIDIWFYDGIGVIIANVFLFWSYQSTDFIWPHVVCFSPISWSSLSTYTSISTQQLPSVWLGLALSTLLDFMLILLLLLINGRERPSIAQRNDSKEESL